MTSLAELRKNYSLGSLDVGDVDRNPFRQFDMWFKQAVDAQLPEPNTMTVATVDSRGRPSARIVLIKGVDERGFVFFTNYESRKGRELAATFPPDIRPCMSGNTDRSPDRPIAPGPCGRAFSFHHDSGAAFRWYAPKPDAAGLSIS